MPSGSDPTSSASPAQTGFFASVFYTNIKRWGVLAILILCFIASISTAIILSRTSQKPPVTAPAAAPVTTQPTATPLGDLQHLLKSVGTALLPPPHATPRAAPAISNDTQELPKPSAPAAARPSQDEPAHADTPLNRLMFAVLDLQEAVLASAPYSKALRSVDQYTKKIPAIAPSLAALRPYADIGMPSLTFLQKEFDTLAADITATDLRKQHADSIWGKALTYLLSYVTIRKIDPHATGADPVSIIARSYPLVQTGHVADALHHLDALPADSKTQASQWIQHATAYVTCRESLETILETLRY